MAGGRLIATGTRLNGETVELRTPHMRMGLDRYSAGLAVGAEMQAMGVQIHELIPFDEIDIDPETGQMTRQEKPALRAEIGRAALDGIDTRKEN